MKEAIINKGNVFVDGEKVVQAFPTDRKKNKRGDNFKKQSRELGTTVGKDGTIDMNLGEIVTVERELTNRVELEDGKASRELEDKFNQKNKIS